MRLIRSAVSRSGKVQLTTKTSIGRSFLSQETI
jgi:hypothetical protein